MVSKPAADPQITGAEYLRLIGLGAVVGIPAALLAAAFLAFVHLLEDWLWQDLPEVLGASSPPWYLIVGLPVVGAAITIVARRFLPGDGGESPLGGLSAGPTPVSHGPGIALAAIGALAFGAVLGPEMPLIALGSVVGMAIAAGPVRVSPQGKAVLASAGSFSAISALFGGPLVAGMLLVESGLGMGSALLPLLLPGLVAAAIGYVLFIGIGDWTGLGTPVMSVPGLPPSDGTSVIDLLLAIVVGLAAAVVIWAVRRLAGGIAAVSENRPVWPLVLLGGLATGLLALLATLLGDDPDIVLFSGQTAIPELVGQTSTGALLLVLAAKAIAYAVCLGCGFRSGPVFPAIFLGVGLATVAVVLFGASVTWAVAVGTAAGMAATSRLLFAPVLFAALLVGSAGLDAIPAAVLAAAAAWIGIAILDRRGREQPQPAAETTST